MQYFVAFPRHLLLNAGYLRSLGSAHAQRRIELVFREVALHLADDLDLGQPNAGDLARDLVE
nr:hypothetical protein [Mesorhizobium sp.]